MEFVDNKKTPCFCGSEKCSGLIGDKPIEPEKKATLKRKPKRKNSIKILPPAPKRKRTIRDSIDPFDALLEKMKEDVSLDSSLDVSKEEEVDPQVDPGQDEAESIKETPVDPELSSPKLDETQAPAKRGSPLDFHVAGDSHLEL